MWNWRAKRARNRVISAALLQTPAERLEDRSMLAGNVVATFVGSHLMVTGDTADNALELAVENNTVQLRGLQNTTINGGTGVFVVAQNTDTATGNVSIRLGAGNDSMVFARNVKLSGVVNISGEAGNDSISSTGASFQRAVAFHGHSGNDTFSIQDSSISGFLGLYGHDGDDLLSLTDVTLNGRLIIQTKRGEDGVSLNSVTGTGAVAMNTGRGDDDVAIRNSTIGAVQIQTKQDVDFVALEDNTFNGKVTVITGRNNDALHVRDTNTFNHRLTVQMGDSRRNAIPLTNGDAVRIETPNVFNAGRRIRSEESSEIPTTVADRIDAANTGLLARATAADTAASNLTGLVTVTASSSKSEASLAGGNTVITRDANVTISGTSLPGATITLDSDADGEFDDGTVTADATGAYSFAAPVVVTRKDLYTDVAGNDSLNGRSEVRVRSTLSGAGTADSTVIVEFVPTTNKVVRYTTTTESGETQGFEIEMWAAADLAPLTVANFLNYSSSGRFDNSIIHRSVTTTGTNGSTVPFVIQGGGFTVNNGLVRDVETFAPVTSEFNTNRGNDRGTISMAHPGDTNQGTSQWFINLQDNDSLNANTNDRRHTVFGRVLGSGMTVVDAIHALTEVSLVDATGDSALTDVPLRSAFVPFDRTLSGTVTTTAGSVDVVGVGTKFTTELSAGSGLANRSRIQINGQTFEVDSIVDDTNLKLKTAPTSASTAVTAKTDFDNDNQFVRFSTISEVLT